LSCRARRLLHRGAGAAERRCAPPVVALATQSAGRRARFKAAPPTNNNECPSARGHPARIGRGGTRRPGAKREGAAAATEPLSGLLGLTQLFLAHNSVSDLGPLSGLTALVNLDVSTNAVSDLGPLSGLAELTLLGLISNNVSDLTPLVDNPGLATGDSVLLWTNPLDCTAQAGNILTLQQRGVDVQSTCG
jgi:hypothetical protein